MAQVLPARNRGPRKRSLRPPVLKTTQHDIASAFMWALLIAIGILVAWVIAIWLANRGFKTDDDVPIVMLNLGGDPEGKPDDTLKVESPEDPTDDPSVVDTEETESQIEETVETVIELSENAAQQVHNQAATGDVSTGKIGSKDGTGGRPLGDGPGEGGGSNYMRWFIRFSDKGTLNVYAQQLDYFDIRLGLFRRQKNPPSILLLWNMSTSPQQREIFKPKDKKDEIYFTWAGGGRKKADIEMFRKKLKENASGGLIMHFYPDATIAKLMRAEKAKLRRGKSVADIKRTYFVVRSKGGGFEFYVTKITYK